LGPISSAGIHEVKIRLFESAIKPDEGAMQTIRSNDTLFF
jgi:hypothetical protein